MFIFFSKMIFPTPQVSTRLYRYIPGSVLAQNMSENGWSRRRFCSPLSCQVEGLGTWKPLCACVCVFFVSLCFTIILVSAQCVVSQPNRARACPLCVRYVHRALLLLLCALLYYCCCCCCCCCCCSSSYACHPRCSTYKQQHLLPIFFISNENTLVLPLTVQSLLCGLGLYLHYTLVPLMANTGVRGAAGGR